MPSESENYRLRLMALRLLQQAIQPWTTDDDVMWPAGIGIFQEAIAYFREIGWVDRVHAVNELYSINWARVGSDEP